MDSIDIHMDTEMDEDVIRQIFREEIRTTLGSYVRNCGECGLVRIRQDEGNEQEIMPGKPHCPDCREQDKIWVSRI